MRLHLPLSLLAALMACYPIAHADYEWNQGSGTYTATDWNNHANWSGTELTADNLGPGVPDSNSWQAIVFDNEGTLTFNDLALEGWGLKIDVLNGTTVTLSGSTKKIQTNDTTAGYLKVDSSSKLIWNITNTAGGTSGGTFNLDIQSYQGLEIQSSFASSGYQIGALNVSLGSLGSIVSTVSSVASGTNITFTNTVLLQSWESGFNTNSGQYTKSTNTEGSDYILNTRKLWALNDDTTSIGGTLTTSGNTFTLSTGTVLTQSESQLTAGANTVNQFYLYTGDDGAIYVDYVTKAVNGDTWKTTATSGNWSDSSNWKNGSAPTAGTAVANFSGGDNITVTVDQSVSPYMVNISGGTYTFVQSGSGAIAGNGGLLVDGGAHVTMSLANSYTGGTTVNNGTLIVTTTGALGSGTVTIADNGTLQINPTGDVHTAISGTLTLNGGTLAFTEGSHTLSQTLAGSNGNLNVSGSGASLNITTVQSNIALTTVSDGAHLTLNKNGNGSKSMLYGDLTVTGNSTLTTAGGDSFGYSNASGEFGTLTLSTSTWNVTNSNTTMANTTIVLEASKIVLNCGTDSTHGLDLFSGTNTIRTTSNAGSMSTIELASEASNSGLHNSVNLRGGTVIFDINRGAFDLDDTNTSDLKIDVILAKKENNGQGVGFTKTGDGVLQLTKASTVQLDVNLQAGTILLTDAGTLGTSNVIMSSGSFLTLDSSEAKTLSNIFSGTGTITQKGSGNVTLSGVNTYDGETIIQSGTLTAGSDAAFGTSSITLGNSVTLAVGSHALKNAVSMPTADNETAQSATLTASEGATIGSLSLGKKSTLTVTGTLTWTEDAAITLDEGAQLVNTGGTIDWSNNTVTLKLTDANVTTADTAETLSDKATAMVTAGSLTLNGANTTLVMDNEALVKVLTEAKEGAKSAALQLSSGTLTFTDSETYKKTLLGQSNLLTQLGYAISGTGNGALILSGEKAEDSDIYIVVDDSSETYPDTITSYRSLDPYKAVILASDQTLTVELDGSPTEMTEEKGLQISNLVGVEGSTLNVTNSNTDQTALVVLTNPDLKTEEEDITGETVGTDTQMDGSIIGGDAVTFLKTGAGTLTVTGDVSADTFQAEEGGLVLDGATELSALVLNSSDTDNKATVTIGGEATVDSLSEANTLDSTTNNLTGGNLTIANGGQLTLTGDDNSLTQTNISGSGSLNLDSSAYLELSDSAKLDGVAVNMTAAGLQLAGTDDDQFTVSALNGDNDSTIILDDATLTVDGQGNSNFSGQLVGSGLLVLQNGTMNLTSTTPAAIPFASNNSSDVALKVDKSAMNLSSADSDTISYKGITLSNKGSVTVGSADALNQKLSLGDDGLIMGDGCSLTFNLGTTTESELQNLAPLVTTTGAITLSGGTVTLNNDNNLVAAGSPTLELTLMQGDSAATVENVSISAGFLSTVYTDLSLSANGNNVVLNGVARDENIFDTGDLTSNAQAGADLLWGARFTLTNGNSVLKEAYVAVNNMQTNGDYAKASQILAAIAGSTINATGTAQRDALRSQLSLVRDRTTQMGVNPAYVNADLPYFHLWLEGTGSFAKLNTDGDEGGYKLNTWGGTVGMDVDLSDRLTIGAALSANYGDLSASAAEVATGSLDSYYVSLFGRYQSKRWAHTLILTGGWNNADLNRTVHYGSGSYSTQGSTNGYGIGSMYEVTYDVALNESKSSILQPLANLSVVHTGLDSYTESGAGNAGLNVGKQEWTTATVALGARWLGLVGSNIFGREALAELRVNAAQDMGDSQGKTDVSLIGKPGFTQTVRGAKVGTTALQVGAGLSIPVGLQSTIYCNGNADIRSGASALNATLGLRYNF